MTVNTRYGRRCIALQNSLFCFGFVTRTGATAIATTPDGKYAYVAVNDVLSREGTSKARAEALPLRRGPFV